MVALLGEVNIVALEGAEDAGSEADGASMVMSEDREKPNQLLPLAISPINHTQTTLRALRIYTLPYCYFI